MARELNILREDQTRNLNHEHPLSHQLVADIQNPAILLRSWPLFKDSSRDQQLDAKNRQHR